MMQADILSMDSKPPVSLLKCSSRLNADCDIILSTEKRLKPNDLIFFGSFSLQLRQERELGVEGSTDTSIKQEAPGTKVKYGLHLSPCVVTASPNSRHT